MIAAASLSARLKEFDDQYPGIAEILQSAIDASGSINDLRMQLCGRISMCFEMPEQTRDRFLKLAEEVFNS